MIILIASILGLLSLAGTAVVLACLTLGSRADQRSCRAWAERDPADATEPLPIEVRPPAAQHAVNPTARAHSPFRAALPAAPRVMRRWTMQ